MSDTHAEVKAGNDAFQSERYAILFTDLVGSSVLAERMGNDDYKTEVLFPLLKIQRDAITKHSGKPVGDVPGDALMAVFRKTDDALQAALDLLRQTRAWNETDGKRLGNEVWVRVGVHLSTEILHWDETNLLAGHGDCNYASRLMGIADGGQIVVSEQAKGSRGVGEYDWRAWPNRRVKSFEDRPVYVYTLGWDHPNAHKEPGIARVPDWIREENRYIARTELENWLIDCFKRQSDNRPPFRLVTLHGFGGVGKTRLALQCCLLMLPVFESRVRYVRLDLLTFTDTAEEATRRDLLAEAIANAYGLKGDPAKPDNLPHSLPTEMNLLLLDNYETVASTESSKLVTRLIEKNRSLHILVTGRRGVLNANLEKTLKVEPLDCAAARELFLDRVKMKEGREGWTPSSLDETAIEEILTRTDGLPLALVLVAARADKQSLHKIAEGLKQTALGRETTLPANHLFDADTRRHNSLQLCLDWSWALLTEGERHALCCVSLFADDFTGEDVSECFSEQGLAGASVTDDHLEQLQDAALLNREERVATGASLYSLLRPTKEYAQAKQATSVDGETATGVFIARYRRLMETHRAGVDARNPETMAALDPHYRNAGAALAYAVTRESMEDVLVLYGTLWQYLYRALYAEQTIVEKSVLALYEKVLGPEHPNTLTSVNNLGLLLYYKGDYVVAEPLYRRALEARERVLGPEHPDTLQSVHNLAALLHLKGDYAGAEPLYRHALQTRERVQGPEHPHTLTSVHNLACLLHLKGDYAGAEPLYRHALQTRERVLGPEHPHTLTSVHNLGFLLRSKGDYAGAEPLYRRALEARGRVMGAEHPDTLTTLQNLTELLAKTGQPDESAALRKEYISRMTSEKASAPPMTLRQLALECYLDGDDSHAEHLLRRVLEHGFELSSTHCNLALVLLIMDRDKEALAEVNLAWEHRAEGPPYIPQRLNFLQALFGLLDGMAPTESLQNLKTELLRPDAMQEWDLSRLLDHVKPRLTPEAYELMEALAATINDRAAMKRLETLPAWKAIL